MQLISIENLRLTDRNKAGADVVFALEGIQAKAELNFYLQGKQCLTVRLGRHDENISTAELENYINQHSREIRQQIDPHIGPMREEKRRQLYEQDNNE